MKLKRPLIIFDLETTGLDKATDKICSIAVTKIFPDNKIEKKYQLVNPEMQIPDFATQIHGITNELVANEPTFKQISKSLFDFFANSDIGGFNNNNFDNELLQEEFQRAGLFFNPEDFNSIDVCFLFKHFEKRDLKSAVRFYLGEEMENHHNAEADVEYTAKVFYKQLIKYPELTEMSIEDIAKLCNPNRAIDFGNRIVVDKDGDYCYNFGKDKGRKIKNNTSFANWCLNNNFPATFKSLLKKILEKI